MTTVSVATLTLPATVHRRKSLIGNFGSMETYCRVTLKNLRMETPLSKFPIAWLIEVRTSKWRSVTDLCLGITRRAPEDKGTFEVSTRIRWMDSRPFTARWNTTFLLHLIAFHTARSGTAQVFVMWPSRWLEEKVNLKVIKHSISTHVNDTMSSTGCSCFVIYVWYAARSRISFTNSLT